MIPFLAASLIDQIPSWSIALVVFVAVCVIVFYKFFMEFVVKM